MLFIVVLLIANSVFAIENTEVPISGENKVLGTEDSATEKTHTIDNFNVQISEEDRAYAESLNRQLDLEKIQEMAKKLKFLADKLPEIGEGCESCGSKVYNVAGPDQNYEDGMEEELANENEELANEEGISNSNNEDLENKGKNEEKETILVFVSFSMPDVSLLQLSDQLRKHNAIMVMRGIYKNSFKETKDKIMKMSKNGLSINVDPGLFKSYKIEVVPTFVLIKDDKEINRMSGNVSLKFAAKKLRGDDEEINKE